MKKFESRINISDTEHCVLSFVNGLLKALIAMRVGI